MKIESIIHFEEIKQRVLRRYLDRIRSEIGGSLEKELPVTLMEFATNVAPRLEASTKGEIWLVETAPNTSEKLGTAPMNEEIRLLSVIAEIAKAYQNSELSKSSKNATLTLILKRFEEVLKISQDIVVLCQTAMKEEMKKAA